MYVWSFANQKGGTGKTTTAIHTAAALASRGKRVLLIDLDPQGHATLGLGWDGDRGPGLAEVFLGDLGLREAAVAVAGGIHLVPSHLGLSEFEERAERMLGPERILGEALSGIGSHYDHVLVDCPPRADGVLTANALRASDTVILVVETSVFALQGALRALAIFEGLGGERHGDALDIRMVATMYDRRTRLAREILTAMQARFGERLFDSVIRRSVRLREAVAYGMPLQELDPVAPAVTDFAALAQEAVQLAEERLCLRAGREKTSDSPSSLNAPSQFHTWSR